MEYWANDAKQGWKLMGIIGEKRQIYRSIRLRMIQTNNVLIWWNLTKLPSAQKNSTSIKIWLISKHIWNDNSTQHTNIYYHLFDWSFIYICLISKVVLGMVQE